MVKKKVGKKAGRKTGASKTILAKKSVPVKKSVPIKQVPTGVKVIAVLSYIGAASEAIFGLLYIIIALFMGLSKAKSAASSTGGVMVLLIGLGILMIGVGVLYFFIGRGLWRARNWARIITIVFSGLGALGGLVCLLMGIVYPVYPMVFAIPLGIVMLIIAGLIGGYLLFAKEVKKVFE